MLRPTKRRPGFAPPQIAKVANRRGYRRPAPCSSFLTISARSRAEFARASAGFGFTGSAGASSGSRGAFRQRTIGIPFKYKSKAWQV